MTGFSVRNLKYMAKFLALYTDSEIVQAVLAQLSWYHNIALMDKVKNTEIALWYAKQTIENGWSRNVLVHQIESDLYSRQAVADKVTNFEGCSAVVKVNLPSRQLKTRMCLTLFQ